MGFRAELRPPCVSARLPAADRLYSYVRPGAWLPLQPVPHFVIKVSESMSSAAKVPGTQLNPQLAELVAQFAAVKAEASELVHGLKESQFNWRPAPHRWSMAECLLHLNIVGDRYVRLLEKAIEQTAARGRVGRGPFAYGFLGQRLLARTEPPPKRKRRAPRSFTPAYGQPITAVLPTFRHIQEQLALLLEQTNGLDIGSIKVRAPGLGPMRLNLYVTFAWIAAHERRHLWQARQVRNHPKFPAQQGGRVG